MPAVLIEPLTDFAPRLTVIVIRAGAASVYEMVEPPRLVARNARGLSFSFDRPAAAGPDGCDGEPGPPLSVFGGSGLSARLTSALPQSASEPPGSASVSWSVAQSVVAGLAKMWTPSGAERASLDESADHVGFHTAPSPSAVHEQSRPVSAAGSPYT